jgi:hypothetical protein
VPVRNCSHDLHRSVDRKSKWIGRPGLSLGTSRWPKKVASRRLGSEFTVPIWQGPTQSRRSGRTPVSARSRRSSGQREVASPTRCIRTTSRGEPGRGRRIGPATRTLGAPDDTGSGGRHDHRIGQRPTLFAKLSSPRPTRHRFIYSAQRRVARSRSFSRVSVSDLPRMCAGGVPPHLTSPRGAFWGFGARQG